MVLIKNFWQYIHITHIHTVKCGRHQSNAGLTWPNVDSMLLQRQVSVRIIYNLTHKTYLESKLNRLGIAVKASLNTKRIKEIEFPKRCCMQKRRHCKTLIINLRINGILKSIRVLYFWGHKKYFCWKVDPATWCVLNPAGTWRLYNVGSTSMIRRWGDVVLTSCARWVFFFCFRLDYPHAVSRTKVDSFVLK